MKNKVLFIVVAIAMFAIACEKNFDSPVSGQYKRPKLPAEDFHYTLSDLDPASLEVFSFIDDISDITNEGATLGRVLFYDKALSINNATSCGSCHHQNRAFADAGAQSMGFNAGMTKRNSPTCVNMVFSSSFFWDGRATSLTQQVMMPVADHLEMGLDNPTYMVEKVATLDYYEPLFQKAFGSTEVNKEKIASALAQFLRSMVSINSKFDQGRAIEFSNFNTLEKEGYELFNSWDRLHCINCHSGNNFSGWGTSFANIGLEMNYSDNGLGDRTQVESDNGLFKVPTLRNIAVTGPYMHDGRYKTLEEVIEHYNTGVVRHPNLDWSLTDNGGNIFFDDFMGIPVNGSGEPAKLGLTDREKRALIAFLGTLTDQTLLTDERFSDPFY